MKRVFLFALLVGLSKAYAAYDVNGVALGAAEKDVRAKFPSANCKPLEWRSRAADRRCDDSRITIGGVAARVTFYLRQDKVEAFDVRFDAQEVEKVIGHLKGRYGKPEAEQRDTVGEPGKKERRIVKVLWETKAERALLTAQLDQRRGSLLVSRGGFDEEIYRVR